MTTRTLILALLFGVSVAGGSQLMKMQLTATPDQQLSEVIVLLQDVPRGKTLKSEMLSKKNYQANALPYGVIGTMEDAVGRVSTVALRKGVLFENSLAPKGSLAGLQGMIPEGMRAFTVRTPNVASGLAGLVQPGDRVDVLLTVDDDHEAEDSGGAAVVTLLRDIEVLAVDQVLDGSAPPPTTSKTKTRAVATVAAIKSVTLIATPNDAMRLSLAQTKGTLQLSLRSPGDEPVDDSTEVRAITFNDLLGRTKKVVTTVIAQASHEEKPEVKEVPRPAEVVAPEPPVAPVREPRIADVQIAKVPEPPALPPIVMYEGNSRSSINLSLVQGRQFVSRYAPSVPGLK